MRRLIPVLVCLSLGVHATTRAAASAEPRVEPPLDVYIQVVEAPDTNTADSATLEIAGKQCVPNNAPASVDVTVDQFPDKLFTATPNDSGRWFLSIPIPLPVDQTYVINAECDNYFGATAYPQATAGPDDVVFAVAEGAGGEPHPPIAFTGSRTAGELAIGIAAVLLGTLLLWLGRRRTEVPG
jgi:hypothetical protein